MPQKLTIASPEQYQDILYKEAKSLLILNKESPDP
jgi:hypothetical protein